MPRKIRTRKRIQKSGDNSCKVSSKMKGTDLTVYTKDNLRSTLEDNNFLKAKSDEDQNDFASSIIRSIISRASKGAYEEFGPPEPGSDTANPPYLKATIKCMKCLNNSKLHQLIYDNIFIEYKEKNKETGKKEDVPASDEEVKVRLKAITQFINLVLVPSLREYKEKTQKASKTEEVVGREISRILGNKITIDDNTFDETEEAAESLANELFNNKDKIEEFYDEEMTKRIEIKSCNPNDEEDRERCASQGKNPEFFIYLVTGLFAFALVFEFA